MRHCELDELRRISLAAPLRSGGTNEVENIKVATTKASEVHLAYCPNNEAFNDRCGEPHCGIRKGEVGQSKEAGEISWD